ncbi:MAG: Ig-like domain-containing protein [Chloroflexota bacterium]
MKQNSLVVDWKEKNGMRLVKQEVDLSSRPFAMFCCAMVAAFALLIGFTIEVAMGASGLPASEHETQANNSLILEKTVILPEEETAVEPGDSFHYLILIERGDGFDTDSVVLSDTLPYGIRLDGQIEIHTLDEDTQPMPVRFHKGLVTWEGILSTEDEVEIEIPVYLHDCPSRGLAVDGTGTLTNVATLRRGDDTFTSTASVPIDCSSDTVEGLSIVQEVIEPNGRLTIDAHPEGEGRREVVPGDRYRVRTVITNNGTREVVIGAVHTSSALNEWAMASNTSDIYEDDAYEDDAYEDDSVDDDSVDDDAYDDDSVDDDAHDDDSVDDDSVDDDIYEIDSPTRRIRLAVGETASFNERIDTNNSKHGSLLDNQNFLGEGILAHTVTVCTLSKHETHCPDLDEDSPNITTTEPITHAIHYRDLGDAPDSSNHFALAMEAYRGITANFPTVFHPATGTPSGPVHLYPRAFHLGQRVSAEAEADRGPDADRRHNLEVSTDRADHDEEDDGVLVHQLTFTDCTTAVIPIEIFIDPDVIEQLEETDAQGYLNVWVDSNRDGDWDDTSDCPNTTALEHIVIDAPIDVDDLGPGIHTIHVATAEVSWPDNRDKSPTWIRFTLSELPANKTLTANGISYGDGRGYDAPFMTGETEDYFWRPANLSKGVDLSVSLRGNATRRHLPAKVEQNSATSVAHRVEWSIAYKNQGTEVATDVIMTGTLPTELTASDVAMEIRTHPEISHTRNGDTMRFDVGTLESQAEGRIVIVAGITNTLDSLPVMTNQVDIRSNEADANDADNRAEDTVNLGLHAPTIIGPGNGTTCNTAVDITGSAVDGAEVDLYVDNVLVTTLTTNVQRQWSHSMSLTDGTHTIHAIARKTVQDSELTSPASDAMTVIVNSSLFFDPLSLRLIEEDGRVRRPRDANGRTDAEGWQAKLRQNTTYTIMVELCCTNAQASAKMAVPSVGEVDLVYDANHDEYRGVFTTGGHNAGAQNAAESLAISVTCGDAILTYAGAVLIDPEGVVYDIHSGFEIGGAVVACMETQVVASDAGTTTDTAALYSLWNASLYDQVNPQLTGSNGYFSFFTPAGTYQLVVSRSGYQDYRSGDIVVIDELVRRDVLVTPLVSEAADHTVLIDENGFNPAILSIKPGSIIEWINMDASDHTATEDSKTTGTTVWDSGLLQAGGSYKFQFGTTEGVFTYADAIRPVNTATIVVSSMGIEVTQPSTDTLSGLDIYLPLVTR